MEQNLHYNFWVKQEKDLKYNNQDMTLSNTSLVVAHCRRGWLSSRPASQDEAGGGPWLR